MTGYVGLLFAPLLLGVPADAPFEPTSAYEQRRVEGWPVRVNKGFLARDPKLAGEALKLLSAQLAAVKRVVAGGTVAKLQKVTIWVEADEPHHPCMAYHPDAGWLRGHGMNPEKARCVEIANARKFLDWCQHQPWMVFHELAHAYHDQFLPQGFSNAEVRAAFDAAMKAQTYDEVVYYDGRKRRAYATTNPMEYFAEASEAYFGRNDFSPFDRAELKQHDPAAAVLLEKLWAGEENPPK